MEHYRENGNLAHGYFCMRCGLPVGMMGCMETCTPNPKLVAKLVEINRSDNPKDYVFGRLKDDGNKK